MSNYVTLIGTEDVTRAGRAMQDAAQSMNGAASEFGFQLDRLERILQEFGDRIESIMQSEKGDGF